MQSRVNDRGPFARDRIIDVSRRSAQLLGLETNGTALVPSEDPEGREHPGGGVGKAQRQRHRSAGRRGPQRRFGRGRSSTGPGCYFTRAASTAGSPDQCCAAAGCCRGAAILPEKVSVVPVKSSGRIFVQAGAFSVQENAQRLQLRISPLGSVQVLTASVNGSQMYRVRLGPLLTVEQADRALARIVGSGHPEARIVVD
jgi:rare lipoprotein A